MIIRVRDIISYQFMIVFPRKQKSDASFPSVASHIIRDIILRYIIKLIANINS